MKPKWPLLVFLLTVLGAAMAWPALTNAPVVSPPTIDHRIGLIWTFLSGVTGAAVMYLYWFRTERIQKAIASFQDSQSGGKIVPTEKGWRLVAPDWRLLIWDLGISILLGGVAAVFVAENGTWKEAFLLGCTWNSVFARIAKSGEKGNS